jgi:hypothetical protein
MQSRQAIAGVGQVQVQVQVQVRYGSIRVFRSGAGTELSTTDVDNIYVSRVNFSMTAAAKQQKIMKRKETNTQTHNTQQTNNNEQ